MKKLFLMSFFGAILLALFAADRPATRPDARKQRIEVVVIEKRQQSNPARREREQTNNRRSR